MRSKPPAGKVEALALAVACGATVRAWCRAHDVPERTAYAWTSKDEFKARVADLRREMVATALGKLTGTSGQAVKTLKKLLTSESDKVRLGSSIAIMKLLLQVQSHVELSDRLSTVERRLDDAGTPR